MKKIAIIGASGHGKVVADLAQMCGYQVFFFDDSFPNLIKIKIKTKTMYLNLQ